MKRIALFGGTFDPVHRGHLALVDQARNQFKLDRVIFVPCVVSPFKTDRVPGASGQKRAEMLRAALPEIDPGNTWSEVSEIELDRPPPSYSWQTARHFRKLNPNAELYWILGTDQWEQIDQWAEPEILRETLIFIVVTRNETPVRHRQGWQFHPMQFSHPASSTAIREGRGEPGWLPEGIEL